MAPLVVDSMTSLLVNCTMGNPTPMAKLKIVAEEKKNYDPEGPLRLLEGHPRALVLDTEALSPEEEVLAVRRFLQEGLR